ncbi:DUF2007 domain-containing protein [Pseudomonas sp. HR96]|uniref:putative signal transducing protein n=1 Tax=Pseudomonas sp. HR96 TaxID=1027966 RepID=UPI002A754176|nr:DUF2007 domain-containing protein [Pseudomonas sp. HR96]WPP00689.1 DUF2007 domain-containing protein [Pseudomonas sp. HR96]
MRRVYEPGSLMEAQMLVDMLASEGVQAYLSGGDLVGGMGDLPAMGLLSLNVDNDQAEHARQLIAEYNAALPLSGDDQPDSVPGILLC